MGLESPHNDEESEKLLSTNIKMIEHLLRTNEAGFSDGGKQVGKLGSGKMRLILIHMRTRYKTSLYNAIQYI